jgi:hypothetical protein
MIFSKSISSCKSQDLILLRIAPSHFVVIIHQSCQGQHFNSSKNVQILMMPFNLLLSLAHFNWLAFVLCKKPTVAHASDFLL